MVLFARNVPFPALSGLDLHLDVWALEDQFFDPKAKAFVLNNSANPISMIESLEIVEIVVKFAVDSGVIVTAMKCTRSPVAGMQSS
jgi:aspartate/methionine/tyrosine aminotransferase